MATCEESPEPILDDLWFEDEKESTMTEMERTESLKTSSQRDFKEFDANGDGQLDAQEITARFGGYLNAIDMFYFFTNADRDHSGTVSYPEYEAYVVSSVHEESSERSTA